MGRRGGGGMGRRGGGGMGGNTSMLSISIYRPERKRSVACVIHIISQNFHALLLVRDDVKKRRLCGTRRSTQTNLFLGIDSIVREWCYRIEQPPNDEVLGTKSVETREGGIPYMLFQM